MRNIEYPSFLKMVDDDDGDCRLIVGIMYDTWYVPIRICEAAFSQLYSYISRLFVLLNCVLQQTTNFVRCLTIEYQRQDDNTQFRASNTNMLFYYNIAGISTDSLVGLS